MDFSTAWYSRFVAGCGQYCNRLVNAMKQRAIVCLPALVLLFVLAQLVFFARLAPAELLDRLGVEHDADAPWRIEADTLVGLHESEVVEAFGNVTLRRGNDYLRADFARYYRATGWVFLRGGVEARWRGDHLEAEEAEFDLKNRVGWLKNGQLFISDSHLYFSGELIRKRWGDTYTFRNAELTACDGDPPVWSFSASRGDITLDGYAQLWSVSLRVKDTPVLYAPVFSVPVKTRRQSGFLNPDIGVSSLLGGQLIIPYYWAINEESDATLYENFMSKRGFMQGVEYRRHADLGEKSYWRLDVMQDSKVVTNENDEQAPLDNDGLVRTNHVRYWLRSKMDSHLGRSDWKVKLDLDFVSDQNYLREFEAGQSGYDDSRDILVERFGRGIAEQDQNRTSTLLVSRSWDRFGAAGMAKYTQSVEHGHGNESPSNDPTLQRLPELYGFFYRSEVLGTPLELEAETRFGKYWRAKGTQGNRLDFAPRASITWQTPYGALVPSAGYRQTLYAVERKQSLREPESEDRFPARTMWDVQVDGFTEFARVYALDSQLLDWTALRHSVQPRLRYTYIPYVRQAKYPFFDELDRIEPVHELGYTLTNVMTRKKSVQTPAEGEEKGDAVAYGADYKDVLRLRLEGAYNFREATRDEDLDAYPRRPFSDILADVTLYYGDYVELRSRTWFSPYLAQITEHEQDLRLTWPEWGEAVLGYDYMDDIDEYTRKNQRVIRMVRASLAIWPVDYWRLELEYEADMELAQDVEKKASLTYSHECFDVTTVYSSTGLEDRVELWLNLTGVNFF